MSARNLLARLTGRPTVAISYRAHWRVMRHAHPLILHLLEDNADGETRRASLAEWHRAERPVVDVLRGTNSLLRIDGPRLIVGSHVFAMGAFIESPGVTAHLDPVETLQLEQRVRRAIEVEILRWIDEQGLQDRPAAEPHIDRAIADPIALARMADWVAGSRWIEADTYVL